MTKWPPASAPNRSGPVRAAAQVTQPTSVNLTLEWTAPVDFPAGHRAMRLFRHGANRLSHKGLGRMSRLRQELAGPLPKKRLGFWLHICLWRLGGTEFQRSWDRRLGAGEKWRSATLNRPGHLSEIARMASENPWAAKAVFAMKLSAIRARSAMSRLTMVRCSSRAIVATLATLGAAATTFGDGFWFADHRAMPGIVMSSDGSNAPREVFRRASNITNGASDSVPKIGCVAPGKMLGQVFFASGLDRYIFRADGGRQVLAHTHSAQVRDLAFGDNPDLLYYSVVPTPQNGEPVPNGEIFSYHVKTKEQKLVWQINQADLPAAWWGAFAARGNRFYLATFDPPTQILEWSSDGAKPVLQANGLSAIGLDIAENGDFYLAASDGKVYLVRAGEEPQVAFESPGRKLSDVAISRFSSGF